MDTIGDYSIIKQIGKGPLGVIYLAEHRFIKKTFALKVFYDEIVKNISFVGELEKLQRVFASMDHPSIVKIHNFSFSEGKYFLVMDPIVDKMGESMNLGRFLELKGKSLIEEEIENILFQIASALDFLHGTILSNGKALFHGSLNLNNILIGKSEEGIKLSLADVGVYSLLGEKEYIRAMYRYQSEAPSVSPFFLAPEQYTVDRQTPGVTADSYAFGVLSYYLITQSLPQGFFTPLSQIMPHAKSNWDLLIYECLQKDPAKRPLKKLDSLLKEPRKPEYYSWKEIEEKVQSNMQMSFEFSKEKKQEEPPSLLKPVIKPQEINRPTYDPDPGTVFQKDLSVSLYQPTKVEIKEVEPLLTEMVVIPGGTYFRGSKNGARDEMPRHAVLLKSFALDIHPITNEQFVRFLMAMGGEKDMNNNDIIRLKDSRIKRSGGKILIESGYNRHPVVGVTWYGAVAYAKWVGKRLITEAEWEIAACGGDENCSYPTGDDIERSQANFFSSDTTAVMSYPPNNYGLYDMVGNVYEWCHDWYAYNYYEASLQEPENPMGPPQGVYRVLRGGCWKSLKEDLRCSHRHRNNPGAVNGTYGFRCAADVS